MTVKARAKCTHPAGIVFLQLFKCGGMETAKSSKESSSDEIWPELSEVSDLTCFALAKILWHQSEACEENRRQWDPFACEFSQYQLESAENRYDTETWDMEVCTV